MAQTQAAMNLFAGPQATAAKSKYLVEFKAGKMTRENTTVTADPRKGLVYMNVADDGLLHFYWKDRKSGQVETDLILFPEEATWDRVEQCTTGRVYVLKFKTSAQRVFFWMQEADESKDKDLVTKLNKVLVNPMSVSQGGQQEGQNEQADLLRLLTGAGAGGSSGAQNASSANNTGTSNSASAPMQDIQNIVNRVSSSNDVQPIELGDVITVDNLAPVLRDENVRQRLFPFLPSGFTGSESEMQDVLRSPQFQQALQSISYALRSGQLGPLLQQLGMDFPETNNEGDRLLNFLRALQRRTNNSQQNEDHSMEEN